MAPALSTAGLDWSCAIVPAVKVLPGHGAMLRDEGQVVARYDSSQGATFFGWEDAGCDTPTALADKFLARFADVAARGWGEDTDYARWFTRMLRATAPDGLIYARAGWDLPDDHLPALGCTADVMIPMPPPVGVSMDASQRGDGSADRP